MSADEKKRKFPIRGASDGPIISGEKSRCMVRGKEMFDISGKKLHRFELRRVEKERKLTVGRA